MYLMFAKVGIFIVFYFVKCNLFFIICFILAFQAVSVRLFP